MTGRASVEARLRRLHGPSADTRDKLKAVEAVQDDWRGQCRYCGNVRIGHVSEFLKPCPNCGAGPQPRL